MDSTTSDEDEDNLDKALSARDPTSRVRFLNPAVGEYVQRQKYRLNSIQSFSRRITISIYVSLLL